MNQAKLFGKRVPAIRKAARITQEAAAETAHLNPKYLGEIERGKKRPSFEAMTSLAKALKVSPEAFFQFDRDETDERTVRRKIEGLLTLSDRKAPVPASCCGLVDFTARRSSAWSKSPEPPKMATTSSPSPNYSCTCCAP